MADGWSNPLRYETDGVSFTLISSGPDRAADTSDDIIYGPFLTVEESRQIQFYDDPFTMSMPASSMPAASVPTGEYRAEDQLETTQPDGEDAAAEGEGEAEPESDTSPRSEGSLEDKSTPEEQSIPGEQSMRGE